MHIKVPHIHYLSHLKDFMTHKYYLMEPTSTSVPSIMPYIEDTFFYFSSQAVVRTHHFKTHRSILCQHKDERKLKLYWGICLTFIEKLKQLDKKL